MNYLRKRNGTLDVLTPSMRILPLVSGTKPNRVRNRLDFPLPVLPAIPIFSPGPKNNKLVHLTSTKLQQAQHKAVFLRNMNTNEYKTFLFYIK